ncbi:Protein ZINC INDUCED FACILITATOR-LIKE 1, partial [Tetrabaena socialis]
GTFSFASFTTAYAWGCASNYIGRKPVIVVGNVVSFISILWFGLSGSYAAALAARVFGGFFNGILGAWKCMIGESTEVLLQGKFFGYMSLAWGLGCIAGPAVGGAFARPCARMVLPLCGRGELLADRPYFLACLVASTSILASALLSVLLLEETLPAELAERGVAGALRRWRARRGLQQREAGAGGGELEVVVLPSAGGGGGDEGGEAAWPHTEGARLLRGGRPLSDECGDEGAGGGGGGGGGGGSSQGMPLRSPSLARFRQLLRLTSRNYVGGNPFARSGSSPGSASGSWRR